MARVNTGELTGIDMAYMDPPTPNHPLRETTEQDRELARRIESVLLRKPPLSFEEMLEEYRRIEAESVTLAGEDEFSTIETKRRIAEWILTAAFLREQPFDVCQKAWNDLLAVGFSSRHIKCTMICAYADCCWENEQDEVGLAVVEPAIIELEHWLMETTLESQWRLDYDTILANLKRRRDQLKSGHIE